MENYQEYWENYEAKTRSTMQRMSDEELIAAHNREVVTHGCGYARSIYVSALREEILRRDWDAEILFKREANGKTISYRLAIPVVILEINGRKTLIQNRHQQKNKP